MSHPSTQRANSAARGAPQEDEHGDPADASHPHQRDDPADATNEGTEHSVDSDVGDDSTDNVIDRGTDANADTNVDADVDIDRDANRTPARTAANRNAAAADAARDADPAGNTITPLPGEPGIPNIAARQRQPVSTKGLLGMGVLLCGGVAVLAVSVLHVSNSGKKAADPESKLLKDKPAAAMAEPRRLEMPPPSASAVATTPQRSAARGPADEGTDPLMVGRPATGCPLLGGSNGPPPEDAPVMLVTTRPGALGTAGGTAFSGGPTLSGGPSLRRVDGGATSAEWGPSNGPADPNNPLAATARNLQGYQRQLQVLMDNLGRTAALASGQSSGQSPGQVPPVALAGGPQGALEGGASGAPIGGAAGGPFSGHPGAAFGGPSGAPDGLHPGAIQGRPSSAGTSPYGGPSPAGGPPSGGGLFGGQLQASATPRVAATLLGNRSLTLPKGTAFTCALKTAVISATSGLVGCQVQRNVFSDDGRVLLIERGSHLDGEYRNASVRPGMVRIPVLWTRIRTPLGVTVDIESPGTGQLGESGIDGYVDNRWGERLGAAMLLSLIDDSVKLVIQNQASDHQGDTIVLPSTTANTSKLAEKVLDSTINIPPLIYQNQGGLVGIYVARDVDFSSVYELQPTAIEPASQERP